MAAAINYVGKRGGRLMFVPGTMRRRFVLGHEKNPRVRIVRQATPEETAAAAASYGAGLRVVRLDSLTHPGPSAEETTIVRLPSPSPGAPSSLTDRRAAGETLQAIADDLGVSVATVRRRLKAEEG